MKRFSVIASVLILCVITGWAQVPLTIVSGQIDIAGMDATTVAWGDVDGNGFADLFIGDGGAMGSRLFLNSGNGFTLAADLYSVSTLTNVRTAQFIDYNGDGDLDLFSLVNDASSLRLMRQTADHRFQEVAMLPANEGTTAIRSAAWLDFDHDGDLDVMLSNHPDAAEITWLEQDGTDFVEVRAPIFPGTEANASAICAVDFDLDEDLDLFFGSDGTSGRAKLFRNHNGAYEPWHTKIGLPFKCGASGAVWTDVDNDGFPDLILPGLDEANYLLHSEIGEEGRTLTDWTDVPGFREGTNNSVYTHTADFNRDGYPDLLVIRSGSLKPILMINNGGESWTNQLFTWPTENQPVFTKACALGDFDNDGDMDIVLAQGSRLRLYRNDAPPQTEWVALRLVSTNGAPVIGCRLSISFDGRIQNASTSALTSAAGHDQAQIVLANWTGEPLVQTSLQVAWPNGIVRDYTNISLRRIKTLTEPAAVPGPGSDETARSAMAVELTNSPNPFNPSTTISFSLPSAVMVKLAVYDLLGREVALLTNAPYTAGNHSVTFDASSLPSGLYFAHLTAGTETKLHRMLLMK